MKITGIRVPADAEQPIEQVELEQGDIAQYQSIVGGCFDVIDLDDPAASLWFNDEGKLIGLPINERATGLLWAGNKAFAMRDYIAGDVLVLGLPDNKGDTTGAPEELFEQLQEATR